MAGNTETVTVVRPVGRDAFGDPLPGTPPEHDIEDALFAPGPSREPGFTSNTVEADGTIYFTDPEADVLATDLLRIRGDLYSVIGKPQKWLEEGLVVAVRRVTG